MASVFKKILKTSIWMVFIGALLFLMIVALIQIPTIQTKIVRYATNIVSDRTHTKVEVKKINISFPKSVVIEGLYLEDIGKDTLVYAKTTKINIALYDLLKKKIAINSIVIEGVNINLYSTKTDSLFNYNFLITAFGDTTDLVEPVPKTASQWTFGLENINLKNIRVNYDDQYGGISVAARLKKLKLKMDNLDLEKSIYSIKDLLIDGMSTTIQMKKNGKTVSSGKAISEEPGERKFNVNYLYFKDIFLEAKDLYYDSSMMKVSLEKFSAIDQNNFAIKSLQTDFSMDKHSITSKNLKLKTTFSCIDADFNINFDSLETFAKSYEFSNLNLNMRNVILRNSDILYFSPKLIEQPFFENKTNITTITGLILGSTSNLIGENLTIKTGTNSLLQTDFNIKGLPKYETAFFDFSNLKINTGRKDIEEIVGAVIPENIKLPKNISSKLTVKGQMKSFKSTANINSSFGNANLSVELKSDERFIGKVKLSNFDIGSLLKDTLLYSPLSLSVQANGKVSDKQFEGKIKLNDENMVFDLSGLVNLNSGDKKIQLQLDMKKCNLKKLNLTKDDLQVSFVASADLKGKSVNDINGTSKIENVVVVMNGEKYLLDNFLSASLNEAKQRRDSSALVDINYFPISDSLKDVVKSEPSKFNFEIYVRNHPIFSDVFLPELKEFDGGVIKGSLDSENDNLRVNAKVKKIIYGTTQISDLLIKVNSDSTALNYSISSSLLSNSLIKLDNFLIEGKLADNMIFANLSSVDDNSKDLFISTEISKENGNYKLWVNPEEFYLMNNKWTIADDNYIEFGEQGFFIHHLFMNNAESQVNIASVNNSLEKRLANIKMHLKSIPIKSIENFSMGQISESSGSLSGEVVIGENTNVPEITGQLVFNNVSLKPAFLNTQIGMKNETIQIKNDGIYFKDFTITDNKQNTAILNGVVKMKQFSDFNFALNVSAKDFLLFNTTSKDNKEFFGRMIIDSNIDVMGPMNLPVIKARFKMKKGSNFTFAVPEDQLTTDKGEDVVEFEDQSEVDLSLNKGNNNFTTSSGMSGFELNSIIEIDKEATLMLLMDPASTDYLKVNGEAALSFTMDQSGKMSLTGTYSLSQGSYMVSLESIIKKRFDIEPGSTIVWNGDPLDANIDINAKYTVRTSPYDLVADQISGLSDSDKSGYKQQYPFFVILKLRGDILHPEIGFEIQLSPQDKGILDGAVNQKLNLLKEDESALNKQVFALLVLGRFIQENPFQAEMAGETSTIIRSTVSKFLSSQLNKLSSKVLPGVELNFNIHSYDDYESGQAEGMTQVEIGVKNQLFNDRLSVQLGGTVDVEGDQAKQNSASDITSDVIVEYKLTKDGRFRMKGFRQNQYEGVIEGQLVETGVGLIYLRDFNFWSRLFKSNKKHPKASEVRLEKK